MVLPRSVYVPVNSKTAHPPPGKPGHLTRVKLRTVGNLTQNGARPVGHLTSLSKRLSAVRNKRISQFFASAHELCSRVIALVDSMWVFFCCCRFIQQSSSSFRPLFSFIRMTCSFSLLSGLGALFLLYHLLFRSPITDRVWNATGLLVLFKK